MNTLRITYLLLISLLIVSCDQQDINMLEDQAPVILQSEEVLQWSPPYNQSNWITLENPPEELIIPESEAVLIPESKAEIEIVRDTLDGIAVRQPGKIVLPEYELILAEQDPIEAYYAISYVSTNNYFGINFDNDIFSNTDYYYTNGICFKLSVPVFAASPFAWPMLPYRKESMNYHGITAVQNMYTPTNPDTISVFDYERPFCAYLYLGHFKNTLSKKKRYRQYSEIILGIMGPTSLGGFVQSQIHNIEPIGWENQIQNDLVLNYSALVEKGIFNPGFVDLNLFAEGQIGTLYDNLGGGVRMRVGKLNPYFSMPELAHPRSIEHKDALNLQYGIIGSAKLKFVAYDATLQGGFFNPNNNYTIPASDIERIVFQAGMGIYFAFKQLGITYKHFYISPEHKNARHHQWGHINLTYCF